MLRIRLPYPARSLSPNRRNKMWQASLKPKKEAREVGYYAAANCYHALFAGNDDSSVGLEMERASKVWDKAKPLRLRIAIHPPDNRRRDLDNIVAALKPYQDGVFDYIGLDDSQITRKEVVLRRSCPDGKVRYILYQKQEAR